MNELKENQLVSQWGIFEWVLQGPGEGNPFLEVQISAQFYQGEQTVEVNGFYDGEGVYRIRFMPDTQGMWTGESKSNKKELDGVSTSFVCIPSEGDNHGPVRVDANGGLRYADGKPYSCIGTTAYAWIHQGEALAETTLASLKSSPFNKIRMTVFPKSYRYNEHNDPDLFVFPVLKKGRTSWDGNWDNKEKKSDWAFDVSRFDVRFFHMLEKRILQLMEMGVEADVILFHPYDRWGFARLSREVDLRYLKYITARLSAYRNVWWSLANEYDFLRGKTDDDWETIGLTITQNDPHHHMTGIHNGARMFDHNRPWVTHCSIQTSQFDFKNWRETYGKPIVLDEMCYEGNISEGWGNISAMEMVHRFWEVAVQGGYPGHSEVCLTPEHVMWWNKGGKLRGESPSRIAFLREIMEAAPDKPFVPCPEKMSGLPGGSRGEGWLLGYTGVRQPIELRVTLPVGKKFKLQHMDVWNMLISDGGTVEAVDERPVVLPLTGRPYMAFLLTLEE